MSILNEYDVLQEILVSIRNSDIFTTTIRDVNRVTDEGVLDENTEIIIERNNVKNVKSVKVASVNIIGYVVDYESDNECTITLPTSMSGAYEVIYDYGTDKIFIDYPRNDLSINSFPRIAITYIDIVSVPGGFGNVNRNKHDLSIIVYSSNKKQIRDTIKLIRTWCINNQNNLTTLRLIKPVMQGPIVLAGEFTKFGDKIMKQNFDFAGLLQYEVNN